MRIGIAGILLLILAAAFPAAAQDELAIGIDRETLARYSGTFDRIDAALREREKVSAGEAREWLRTIGPVMDAAGECVDEVNLALQRVDAQLKTLGEPVEGEDPEVRQTREALQSEKVALQRRIARCRVLVLRGDDLIDQIGRVQQARLAEHLFQRGPSVVALLYEHWREPELWVNAVRTFLGRHSGLDAVSLTEWAYLVGLMVLGLAASLALRRRLDARLERSRGAATFSGRFSRALASVYAHYLPHLVTSIIPAAALYWLTGATTPVPFVSVVAYGLPFYFLLLSLVHLFVAPQRPEDRFIAIDDDLAHPLTRRLQLFALLVFFGYLLFAVFVGQRLPETALLTARAAYAGVLVLNLIWVLWLLGQIPRLENLSWFRATLTFILLGALLSEWAGYRNLSVFILGAVIGTLVAFGFFVLVNELVSDLFDGLDGGARNWHRQLRRFVGLKPTGPIRGLAWLRALSSIAIWLLFAGVLLRIWGMSDTGFERLRAYLADGFTIGSLTIVPARVAVAVIVLAVLLTVSGWFRTRMERSWLAKTRMDRGAREALVTISGYAGVGIAILMGLAVAGVDFGNLALIAGALSVGIGFGLQNIVNNFVSGLILLFERPIKTGDWIVVGDTQGYVKRISIRSTQIQTFDQADVIVPNSDLISNQVINWMLRDPRGRIKVPVRVAYGSDTDKVKELMLTVAREHPLVVINEPLLEPIVLFTGYGESSLNFELRCFIHYIDELVNVTSDLYFSIDKVFREHGVEVPFPQRDIHLRDRGEQDELDER